MKKTKCKKEMVCKFCGKKFLIWRSDIKRGGGRWCSRKCYMTNVQINGGRNNKGGTMRHRGYILQWAPDHKNSVKGYVYQHRIVMELSIGRLLLKEEIVHHINGVKDDNRIDNLKILSASDHIIEHKAILVLLDDKKIPFTHACRKLGISPATVRERMERYCLNRQDAINYYSNRLK